MYFNTTITPLILPSLISKPQLYFYDMDLDNFLDMDLGRLSWNMPPLKLTRLLWSLSKKKLHLVLSCTLRTSFQECPCAQGNNSHYCLSFPPFSLFLTMIHILMSNLEIRPNPGSLTLKLENSVSYMILLRKNKKKGNLNKGVQTSFSLQSQVCLCSRYIYVWNMINIYKLYI